MENGFAFTFDHIGHAEIGGAEGFDLDFAGFGMIEGHGFVGFDIVDIAAAAFGDVIT